MATTGKVENLESSSDDTRTERVLPRPRGLLLDLGNTVLREAQYDFPSGLKRLHELCVNRLDEVEFASHVSNVYRDLRAHLLTSVVELSFQAFLRLALQSARSEPRVSIPDLEYEFWKAACEMAPVPGIHGFVRRMSELGVPMGVVSNAMFSSGVLNWKLDSHGIKNHFSFLMSSAEYGVRKPHPAIFRAAASRLNLEPEEIWFVGDSLNNDISGAKSVGMTAIWFNARGGPNDGTPHAVISNWDEGAILVESRLRRDDTHPGGL